MLSSCVALGTAQAKKAKDRDVLMVIGNTGAGKSTLVNYLAGCTMEMVSRKDAGFTDGNLKKKIARVAEGSFIKEVMRIGHLNQSATFLPAVYHDEGSGLTLCDCPGFLDNRGAEINIANACNIKQMIAQAKSVRVVVLINYDSLEADRGRGVKELVKARRAGGARARARARPGRARPPPPSLSKRKRERERDRAIRSRRLPCPAPRARSARRSCATSSAATRARSSGTRPRCSSA